MAGTDVTVLVVEDGPRMRKIVKDYLNARGYRTVEAGDGLSAVRKYKETHPDIIILDIMLPGIDGYEAAQKIRNIGQTPIIMLTAKSEEEDTLKGLDIGADDYITKPFSLKELEARIKAVLRRYAASGGSAVSNTGNTGPSAGKPRGKHIKYAGFALDTDTFTVSLDEKPLRLTPAQFTILQTFLENPGTVFTRERLLAAAFPDGFENMERTIDAHVKNIRKIIEPDHAEPVYLKTVWGIGYRFVTEEELK